MKSKQEEKVRDSIKHIKQNMNLINFENMQPPYLLNTLSILRKTHLRKHLQNKDLKTTNNNQVKEYLSNMNHIVKNLDKQFIQEYRQVILNSYIKKIRQKNKQMEPLIIPKNKQFFQGSSKSGPLFWVAQWLLEIQITEDLLSRVQLYFQISAPNISSELKERSKQQVNSSQDESWAQYFIRKIKVGVSKVLKQSSRIIQTPLFTGVVSSALVLTLYILKNSILPLQAKFGFKYFIPVGLVAILPSIFDQIANSIDQSQNEKIMKKWQFTFMTLTESINRFNTYLQKQIQACFSSQNPQQFHKQKTNLQKIINSLNSKIQLVTQFEEQKLQQIKLRTEAYFKQYIQIEKGQWTLVTSQDVEKTQENTIQSQLAMDEDKYQQLKIEKSNSYTNNLTISDELLKQKCVEGKKLDQCKNNKE